jgi:hypothetical protein
MQELNANEITAVRLRVFQVSHDEQYWVTRGARFGTSDKLTSFKYLDELDDGLRVVVEKLARLVAMEGRCPDVIYASETPYATAVVYFEFRVSRSDIDRVLHDTRPIEDVVGEVELNEHPEKVFGMASYYGSPVGFRLKRLLGYKWPLVVI